MDTILNSISDVLGHAEVSAIDCARFIRNILDAKPAGSKLTDAQFISKVIENGVRHMRSTEMSLRRGSPFTIRASSTCGTTLFATSAASATVFYARIPNFPSAIFRSLRC